MMTRVTPFSSQASTVAVSRTPPPSCTGTPTDSKNPIYSRRVHRLAGESPVEIDNVQIFEALLLECTRLRRRVTMEDSRTRHIALLQPHGESFLQVDGGKEDHGDHFKKFEITARPNFWLFSG